jgi:hypothetical protein
MEMNMKRYRFGIIGIVSMESANLSMLAASDAREAFSECDLWCQVKGMPTDEIHVAFL